MLVTIIGQHYQELATNPIIAFSLALNQTTDMVDTAQLSVLITCRSVDKSLNVMKYLLDLRSMKDSNTGANIDNEDMAAIEEKNLTLQT